MIFKPMKREDVLKALEGQENVLDKAVKEQNAYFQRLSCPSCGGKAQAILNVRKLFSSNGILPNYLGQCESCGVEFEPYTGIQVTMPNP